MLSALSLDATSPTFNNEIPKGSDAVNVSIAGFVVACLGGGRDTVLEDVGVSSWDLE